MCQSCKKILSEEVSRSDPTPRKNLRGSTWKTCCIWLSPLMLIACFHRVLAARGSKPTWKLHLDLHYVKMCPEPAIMSCPTMDYFLSKQGELMYNASCSVSKNVKELTEATFKLTRCRDAVSSNTCEYYKTFQWSIGICDLLRIPSLPLGQMWKKWSPPMYCPVSAGNYTMSNVKINLQDVGKIIDLPGYVWMGTSIMRARNDVFECKTFEFKATKTRA